MIEAARSLPDPDDDVDETAALIVAVSEARSDPRAVSHEDMRSWLLEIAAGNFTAPPPDARLP